MDRPPGKKVVLTRAPEDNAGLARALRARGLQVVEIPCVATELVRPPSLPPGPFHAVAFTSRRAVRGVFEQDLWEPLVAAAKQPLVAAVGAATAEALRSRGVAVEITAGAGGGEELGRLLIERLASPARILLPGGDLRAGGLERVLAAAGHRLQPLLVYRHVEPPLPHLQPFAAVVQVASPSAARRLLSANPWLAGERFLAIGKTTAGALGELGVSQVELLGEHSASWEEALSRAAAAGEEGA